MKILLLKPKSSSDTVIPPLGLGYIASRVKGQHEVKIIDCLKEKMSIRNLSKIFYDYKPDVLGIQVYNIDKEITGRYLDRIKKIKKDTVTVIGGPYPSCEPEKVFEYFNENLDYAFCGEAESGFEKFINNISEGTLSGLNEIEGLVYRHNGEVKINFPGVFLDTEKIGYPAWDLLDPSSYPPSPVGAFLKAYPATPIVVSRGCPFKCSFCAGWKITGTEVRYRDIDNVMEEMKMLYKQYGIREFHILDDNFTYNRRYLEIFCNSVIESGMDIKLACPNGIRIDTVDIELLMLMKDAGFYVIHIGIESGSQKILNYMGKVQTIDMITAKINQIKTAGMDVCGYFILGYPGETADDLKYTLKLALSLPLDRSMFMNFLPIPGTPIFDSIKNNSQIYGSDSDKKSFYNVGYSSGFAHSFKIKLFQLKAFLLFYSRPGILFKNITDIYNLKHMFFIARRIIRILVNV